MKPCNLSTIELESVCGGIRSLATCGASMLGGTVLGVSNGGILGYFSNVPSWVGRGKLIGGITGAVLTYTLTDACK